MDPRTLTLELLDAYGRSQFGDMLLAEEDETIDTTGFWIYWLAKTVDFANSPFCKRSSDGLRVAAFMNFKKAGTWSPELWEFYLEEQDRCLNPYEFWTDVCATSRHHINI
jgi:hypothetical protein